MIDKGFYIELLKEILDLFGDFGFWEYIKGNKEDYGYFDDWSYSNNLDLFSIKYNGERYGFSTKAGYAKGALVSPELPYIFKFSSSLFHYTNSFDQCGREAEIFLDAKDTGLESFFAESLFLTEINGLPFYLMRRATFDYTKEFSEKIEGSEDEGINFGFRESPFIGDEEELMFLFGRDEGERKICEFFDFVEEWEIDDIHTANMGIIDGRLVLTDYSGYWEEA